MDWHKIPSLSSLRAFEATARLSSFSKAARELNVTHAAIAQHVRNLENYFSHQLVERQGRNMVVTEKGAALSESLKSGFATIADGVDRLQQFNEDRPINISMTPAFASNWLMPRICSFWEAHPEVTVNLNPSVKLIDMVNDGFDMTIRFGDGNWPNLNVEPLVTDEFLVVASPSLIKGRNVDCLADVQGLPWMFQTYMHERRTLVKSEGVDLDEANITMFETNELVLSAVRAGLGLSLQPAALVEQDIASEVFVKICKLKDRGLGYYMITRKDRETPALVKFQKWLRRIAKNI